MTTLEQFAPTTLEAVSLKNILLATDLSWSSQMVLGAHHPREGARHLMFRGRRRSA